MTPYTTLSPRSDRGPTFTEQRHHRLLQASCLSRPSRFHRKTHICSVLSFVASARARFSFAAGYGHLLCARNHSVRMLVVSASYLLYIPATQTGRTPISNVIEHPHRVCRGGRECGIQDGDFFKLHVSPKWHGIRTDGRAVRRDYTSVCMSGRTRSFGLKHACITPTKRCCTARGASSGLQRQKR